MTSAGTRRTIPLHRAYAAITVDTIAIRPSRRDLVGPVVQAALAILAVWAIVAFMNALPLWALLVLLVFAIVAGPTAMLGFVYQVAGSVFLMERAKGTCRWQQGFLGLGLGTQELSPFPRIKRIEVSGDFDDELPGGDLQDVVRWEVRVVKDNDRVLPVGATVAARRLAGEALARANALGEALADMAGAPFLGATLPAWTVEDEPDLPEDDGDEVGGNGGGDDRGGDDEVARASHPRVPRCPATRPGDETLCATIDQAVAAIRQLREVDMERAAELMRGAKTIAAVGISSDPTRPSNDVARYLIEAGYTVYLVNPTEDEVFGMPVYDSVRDVPEPVDIVDIFRRPEFVGDVVKDAIASGARAVWMQLGIVNEAAAAEARASGLEVVMDRCTKIEHRRLRTLGV